MDFVPPLTNQYPLIRTFRITDPSGYARTVLIEALQRAGVVVSAAAVEPNPVQILPASRTYASSSRVAQLVSPTYAQDTSLVLFGLANNGTTTMSSALAAESGVLATRFGVPVDQLHFIDGSGGGVVWPAACRRPAILGALEPRESASTQYTFDLGHASPPDRSGFQISATMAGITKPDSNQQRSLYDRQHMTALCARLVRPPYWFEP